MRELSHRLGGANVAATEGERVTMKSNKTSSHAGTFRHGDIRLCRSWRATFLPEEGYIVPPASAYLLTTECDGAREKKVSTVSRKRLTTSTSRLLNILT